MAVYKHDYPPEALAETVATIFREGRDFFEKRQGWTHRLWRSIVLQPNFYGIGFDFKKMKEK